MQIHLSLALFYIYVVDFTDHTIIWRYKDIILKKILLLQEFQKELGQWRKEPTGSGVKKKPKYSYKTVDELKAKGKIANRSTTVSAGELAQVKVCLNFILIHEYQEVIMMKL